MKDIITKFHPRHVLEELNPFLDIDYSKNCILCDEWIGHLRENVYQCSCEIYFHEECATTLMESNLSIFHPKTHEHTLTLIRKKNSFNCDACGRVDEKRMNTYACLSCNFFVHKECIYLPKVIKITRHSHRLSHTFHLFGGDMDCQYCHRRIVSGHGGYVCVEKTCDYKLHSYCATDDIYVWDGKDLEGEPEEASHLEDVVSPSLEELDGKVLRHFSHEHDLMRLCVNDEVKDGRICQACILPIEFDSFVGCKECDFALHDTCAILPRKMEHALHRHPLILRVDMMNNKKGFFTCSKCVRESCGFMYRCCQEECRFKLDAKCASLTNPIYHALHQHQPLYLSNYYATCSTCDFDLNFRVATLPVLVKCKYDFHPLTLTYSKSESSHPFWCDICEKILYEMRDGEVYYRCADCNTTLHVECAIGKYPYLKSGHKIEVQGFEIQISSNNCSRPICHTCDGVCQDKLVFINKRYGVRFCSIDCIIRA